MRRPLLNICFIIIAFLFIYMGCRDVNPVASTDSVPAITSVVPAEAPFGATVQIGGEGFGSNLSDQEVYFDNTLAQIEVLSDTSIQTKVPLEATTGPVMVITNSGDTLSGPSFTVDSTKNLFLNIDSINPTKGRAGDEVQIVGNGFSPSPEMNTVLFNNVNTPVTSASDTMLTTTVTPEVETGPVSVVVDQDTAVGPVFTVERLSISGISPESGPIGTAVTISGSGFSSTISENTVTFAGVEAPIETASEIELVAIVPDGAETGPVAVTVGDESIQGPDFTVETTQDPKSLKVITETTNPPAGFDGYRLSVTGRDVVFINPNGERTYTDILADQVEVGLSSVPETCTVSGQNPRTISLDNQSTTTTFSIECALPAPQISSVTPQSGSVGTQVTINGENFSVTPSENIITFNGTEAPVNSANTTELITEVPEGATNGPVEVTVNGQTAEGPTFTVEPDAPAISSIDPQNGVVGTEVTITGENFSATPSENVITFNGTQAPVNSASTTELVTEVPEGATDGPVEVSVDGKTGAGPYFDVVTTGSLDVVIATQGEDQDSNGYLVSIDGAEGVRTSINETYNQSGLQEGTHQVGISDIADNCFITQDRPNPYDVTITAGQTTTTNVDVQCEALNSPPTPSFQVACENLQCQFDASESSDSDGSIDSYAWDFGDGQTGTNQTITHNYEVEGTYTVKLTVTDNEGAESTTTKKISPNLPNISSISPTEGPTGTEVTISGSGFSAAASDNEVEFTSGSLTVPATIKSASETQLVVDVPSDATTGPIYVTTYNYRVSGPTFTVEQPKILDVTIETEGVEQDTDGYTLSVDGLDDRVVKPNDNVTYNDLYVDDIQVSLSGVKSNCRVEGENPRTVILNNSDNYGATTFTVDCTRDLRGKIIYKSDRDNYGELYIQNGDGSGESRLTTSTDYYESAPALSPNGLKIAFTDNSNGGKHIFVMDTDGTDVEQITDSGWNSTPSWSPDGNKIVFARGDNSDAQSDIYIMNSDGSNLQNITNTSTARESNPDWSSDGNKIVFVSFISPDSEIFTIDPDGSNRVQITDNSVFDSDPEWSPSGDRIAFVSEAESGTDKVHIVNNDGTNVQELTLSSTSESSPTWSPDGTRIAFSRYIDGYTHIHIYSVEFNDIISAPYVTGNDRSPHWNYR